MNFLTVTKIYCLIFLFFSISGAINAQGSTQSKIKNFALKYDDGSLSQVSGTLDSAVSVSFVVELKDTSSVKKIYVRISSGQNSTGDIYQIQYDINTSPVYIGGKLMFRREKEVLYILTINTSQLTDLNYEIAVEDYNSQITPYLSWKK